MSRAVDQELTRLGYEHVYRENDRVSPIPGVGGHYFPKEELPALLQWLESHRRNASAKSVTVFRDGSHKSSFGWMRIEETDPIATFGEDMTQQDDDLIKNRAYAEVEAEIVSPNRIEIRTKLVRSYSVFLSPTLVDLSKPVTIVTNGSISFQGLATPSVETLLREARDRRDRHVLYSAVIHIVVAN